MSRIDELKKQHPSYAMSAIDIYKMMSPNQSSKYIEMLIKLDKDKEFNEPDNYRRQMIECMVRWGIDYNYLETFDLETLNMFFLSINNLMGEQGKITSFTKFASLNERKLIENNDVTSYSSWGDIEQAISLAEIKLIDKETAKQIKKIYEDDEWISLRPLSLEASMKYGANTKWCTTTESGQYYARYSARGILIYNINKKTGYKVACFKNLDQAFDNEFSWWDVTDKRIEVLDSEAPAVVLEAIRNEIKNRSVPNQLLMTKAESDKLELYKDGRSYDSGLDIDRMHITGGLSTYTTGNTLEYNPSTFSTTSDHTITFNTTSNVGIGNINPSTQLSVHGDMEINGDVILRSDGVERARLTPDGLQFSGTTRIAADAQQRLDDAVAGRLAIANELVANKKASLLENIDMGTLDDEIIRKMQRLAGIDINGVNVKLNGVEIIDEREAEQPVVHLSLWNKIKNIGIKLSRTFTSRSRKQIGASPMSISARLEAVKQSQEL